MTVLGIIFACGCAVMVALVLLDVPKRR